MKACGLLGEFTKLFKPSVISMRHMPRMISGAIVVSKEVSRIVPKQRSTYPISSHLPPSNRTCGDERTLTKLDMQTFVVSTLICGIN